MHDRPRTTKDLDVLLAPGPENSERAQRALVEFGAPPSVIADLATASPQDIVWWGAPPLRVDLLRYVPGVTFDDAYARRERIRFGAVTADVIGLDQASTRMLPAEVCRVTPSASRCDSLMAN